MWRRPSPRARREEPGSTLRFFLADYGFLSQRVFSCLTSPYVAMGFLIARGMNPRYFKIRSGKSIRHLGDRDCFLGLLVLD